MLNQKVSEEEYFAQAAALRAELESRAAAGWRVDGLGAPARYARPLTGGTTGIEFRSGARAESPAQEQIQLAAGEAEPAQASASSPAQEAMSEARPARAEMPEVGPPRSLQASAASPAQDAMPAMSKAGPTRAEMPEVGPTQSARGSSPSAVSRLQDPAPAVSEGTGVRVLLSEVEPTQPDLQASAVTKSASIDPQPSKPQAQLGEATTPDTAFVGGPKQESAEEQRRRQQIEQAARELAESAALAFDTRLADLEQRGPRARALRQAKRLAGHAQQMTRASLFVPAPEQQAANASHRSKEQEAQESDPSRRPPSLSGAHPQDPEQVSTWTPLSLPPRKRRK